MEREILFRGKRVDNGEWVEGYFVKYQPCTSSDKRIVGIVPEYASSLYLVEVDIETVGRFTDLTDKNGKKIFEGDIVRTEDEEIDICFIRWCNEDAMFEVVYKNIVWNFGEIYGSELEVIGNICDNRELGVRK